MSVADYKDMVCLMHEGGSPRPPTWRCWMLPSELAGFRRAFATVLSGSAGLVDDLHAAALALEIALPKESDIYARLDGQSIELQECDTLPAGGRWRRLR